MKKIILNASKDYNCGYHDGYGDAVEKACEWLKNNTPIGLMEEEFEDFLEDFRKAIE